jgi:hypothetical protein
MTESQDQHTVAVTVKSIFLLNGLLVGFAREIPPGKGGNQYEQR